MRGKKEEGIIGNNREKRHKSTTREDSAQPRNKAKAARPGTRASFPSFATCQCTNVPVYHVSSSHPIINEYRDDTT